MSCRTATLLILLGVVGSLGGGTAAGSAAAPPGAPAAYAEQAYPQTRPSAGQFCKRAHRGVVTRAANGRTVRCTAEGSRSRWKYA